MGRVEPTPNRQIECDGCGRAVPGYDIVECGSIEEGYRRLCSRCFNDEMAGWAGVDEFEHAQFEPLDLTDCTGKVHRFHFRTRLFGTGVALDGFELRDGSPAGYRFQVLGDPKADLLVLFGRLIEKMRRALAIRHVVPGDLGLRIADHQVVRGLIGWDRAEEGRVPLLVIDGREIAWEELGRMLTTFEGWQFKLEIRDKSEEV